MAKFIPLQILRSIVPGKRPDPRRLLEGQPAVNTHPDDPGFYFADSNGFNLIKIGPCSVGPSAPNSEASPPGAEGNSKGELWLDKGGIFPVLRVYDGNEWIQCMPHVYASALVAPTAPEKQSLPDGTLWWNSANGLIYILYNDGDTRQWAEVTSSVAFTPGPS